MKLTAVALACAAVLGSSPAATIVENFSLGSTAADFSIYNIFVDQFDPSLGTLNSVTIGATASSTGGSVQFMANTAGDRTLGIGSQVTISGPVALTLNPNPFQSQEYLGLVAGDSVTLVGTTSSDSDSDSAFAPPSDLSPYIGLGSVMLTVQGVVDTLSVGSALGLTGDAPTNYSVDGTITYTYEPSVPEPGSVLLAVFGGGLLLIRRRR